MYANEEIQNLLAALGIPNPLKGKKKSDKEILEKLRYDKIIIMTDADVDGAHIRLLLLALLYQTSPVLFEQKKVYLALPPLYKVNFSRKEKRNDEIEDNFQVSSFLEGENVSTNNQDIDSTSLNLEALGLSGIDLSDDELRSMGLLPKIEENTQDEADIEILPNKDYYLYDTKI